MKKKEEIIFNIDDVASLFDDLKRPDAIVEAQNDDIDETIGKKEQDYYPRVNLFFSFDIVNSTMYKSVTGNWPLIIPQLLEDIRTRVFKISDLSTCSLWRVIGDEMIFVMPIYSVEEMAIAVDSVFEVTQKISRHLKNGKFFDMLEGQSIQKTDIELLKFQTPLSVKSAAWIAIVNEKVESPYECIKFNYSASSQNQVITEYLGRDIDAGFRLKSYTQDRRLVVSYELAYMLAKYGKTKQLFVMDYVRMKGVWNETLYPIIWFHSAEIVKNVNHGSSTDVHTYQFANSFRYDETDKNEIVNKYFARGKSKKNAVKPDGDTEYFLADSMYKVETALEKILDDRDLRQKMEFLQCVLEKDVIRASVRAFVAPLEVHCAVVCCDVEKRKVMIMHRGKQHSTNPGKWEFGCAKLSSDKSLIKSVVDYYKDTFGLEIELILDKNRQEQQPIPIAVYELQSHNSLKKGIIFIARVINSIDSEEFRAEKSHDSIEWIAQEDVCKYKDNAIMDFENTLNRVFNDFDNFFG